ncbi:MAG TPA: MFS transporter [Anaerolineaceae bacterium]|jgi:ABC-2 type transport system ATP-binding protein|nr:MFS transporter [Anaerolineaceae bacterium]
MITVQSLTKDYGPNRAIENLNFTAEKGEVLGFLGPNGAGKTTTIRILTGFMPPTSGIAKVGGHDVIEESLEVRKLVGYMPETVPLYDDMRVYDYLRYMGQLRHLDNLDERVEDVLEKIGLEDRSESLIKNISKGMRQRVGLGQALIHEPEVLILDEPTIGLDPKQIREVRNLIQEIGKERTVLLSTHILSEAQQICDRVIIINKGLIVAEDAPENLQNRLSSSRKVSVRVGADAEKAVDLIKGVDGVVSAQLSTQGLIQFENLSSRDSRAEVAKLLVQKGFDLLELTPEVVNLEEIFLELTREDAPVAEAIENPPLEESEA